mmetsp:Transcript_35657/g.83435  ORF Transcript_35657/g.83435 Transcript_35657/m.83435 type:complete len:827 (+) Transcript_35657:60-2540(+)
MAAHASAVKAMDMQRRSLLAAFRHQDVAGQGTLHGTQLLAISRLVLWPEASDAELTQLKQFLKGLENPQTGNVSYSEFVEWLYPAGPGLAAPVAAPSSPEVEITSSPQTVVPSLLEMSASPIEQELEVTSSGTVPFASSSTSAAPRKQQGSPPVAKVHPQPSIQGSLQPVERIRRRELRDTIGSHEVELHTQATKAPEDYGTDSAEGLVLGVSVRHLCETVLASLEAAFGQRNDPDFHALQEQWRPKGSRAASPQRSYVETLDMREVGRATVVVSCPWSCSVRTCIDALRAWCAERGFEQQRCFAWHCAFCCSHGWSGEVSRQRPERDEDPEEMLLRRMRSVPNFLALLSPWPRPVYVERAWCMLELSAAVRTDSCHVDLRLAQADEDAFRLALEDGTADKTWTQLKQADISTCRESPSSRPSLLSRVSANSSLINATLRATLQEWFTEKAIRLLRHELQARDRRSLSACAHLAELLLKAADYGHAEEVLLEGQAQVKRLGLETSVDNATLLSVLGLLKMEQAQYAEAEDIYRRAKTAYEEAGACGTEEYAITLERLGCCIQQHGRWKEALEVMSDARRAWSRAGKLHSDEMAALLLKMASCAKAAGLHDDEVSFYEEAKSTFEAMGKTGSTTYLAVLENLGRCLLSQGQYEAALAILLQAKALANSLDPQQCTNYGALLTSIGECLGKLGRTEEAMPYFQHAKGALARAGMLGSEAHTKLVKLMGLRLNLQGLHNQELALYVEAKEEFKSVGATNQPPYAELLSIIGEFLRGQSRFAEAMEYFTEAKKIWESLNAVDTSDYAKLLRSMALCLASVAREAVHILDD